MCFRKSFISKGELSPDINLITSGGENKFNHSGETRDLKPLANAATCFLIWVCILNNAIWWMYEILFSLETFIPLPPGISSWVTSWPITSWSKLKVNPRSVTSPEKFRQINTLFWPILIQRRCKKYWFAKSVNQNLLPVYLKAFLKAWIF